MAADPPGAPTLTIDPSSRTQHSISLAFAPSSSTGGSRIIGYLLYADQGVAGSTLSLLYNGTGKPEVISLTATSLTSWLGFNIHALLLKCYLQEPCSHYRLLLSVPCLVFHHDLRLYSSDYTSATIAISWSGVSSASALAVTHFILWIDDGAGNWPPSGISYSNLATLKYAFTGLTPGATY